MELLLKYLCGLNSTCLASSCRFISKFIVRSENYVLKCGKLFELSVLSLDYKPIKVKNEVYDFFKTLTVI